MRRVQPNDPVCDAPPGFRNWREVTMESNFDRFYKYVSCCVCVCVWHCQLLLCASHAALDSLAVIRDQMRMNRSLQAAAYKPKPMDVDHVKLDDEVLPSHTTMTCLCHALTPSIPLPLFQLIALRNLLAGNMHELWCKAKIEAGWHW